jgi:hypothetical protein
VDCKVLQISLPTGSSAGCSSFPGPGPAPALLTPFVHSTLANNTGYTVDFNITPVPGTGYTFYYEESDGSLRYLNTSFNNCILQRANSGSLDFGMQLDTGAQNTNLWRVDGDIGDPFRDPNQLYIAGLRAKFNSVWDPGDEGDMFWLDLPTPYQGTPGGLAPDHWFLTNAGANFRFVNSNSYSNTGAQLSEDQYDIEGFQRPAYPSRDKGGEED